MVLMRIRDITNNNFGLNVFKAPKKKGYWQPPLRFRHSLGSPSFEYRHTTGF